jgi:hypothetical protein
LDNSLKNCSFNDHHERLNVKKSPENVQSGGHMMNYFVTCAGLAGKTSLAPSPLRFPFVQLFQVGGGEGGGRRGQLAGVE